MNTESPKVKRCRLDVEHVALPTESDNYKSSDAAGDITSPLQKTSGVVTGRLVGEEAKHNESCDSTLQSSCDESQSTNVCNDTSTCAYSLASVESEDHLILTDNPGDSGASQGTKGNAACSESTYESSRDKLHSEKRILKSEKLQVTIDYLWKKEFAKTGYSAKPAEYVTTDASKLIDNLDEEEDSKAELSSDDSSPEEDGASKTGVLGIPAEDLPISWHNPCTLPPLKSSSVHAVLIAADTLSSCLRSPPRPYPEQLKTDEMRWDDEHVRMPHSPQNKFVIAGKSVADRKAVTDRWPLITESLTATKWSTSRDIERTISCYNRPKWDFAGLHSYCDAMADQEKSQFFGHLLPNIAKLALRLPSLCTQPIPLLKTQHETSITMSQEQAACLLANAFFCTFPARNAAGGLSNSPRLPSINFSSLFRKSYGRYEASQHAKLSCLFHYFRRVISQMPCGTVTFHRQV
jgi:Poly (ADP-ribose) glycohydrolase (PARG)